MIRLRPPSGGRCRSGVSLSSAEIAAVVQELAPLAGSRVRAARVHQERALTLELRGRDGEVTLLLSAEADRTRLHASRHRPPSPRPAFPFQALLRREVEGARLVSLECAPGERVVELRFERGPAVRVLVGELTGRHGNLFLLDERGIIRASAGRNLSSRRRLVPGAPYQPPARREPAAAPPLRFAPEAGARFPLSAAVEAHYRPLEEERALAEARRRLRDPLRAAVARGRRALERLAEEEQRAAAAGDDRRIADLLKASLGTLRRGAREASLTEWTEQGPRIVKVALDPALTPRQNMERHYRRWRRIAESAARVAARAAEVRQRTARAEALLAALERAGPEETGRIEREARRLGAAPRPQPGPRRRRREEPALPCRRFLSLGGAEILVGKGAAENDQLTTRLARGNDLWLHARGRAGAHVVLRLARGKAPDQEALLDAAHLAAHFSEARGEASPEVVWTRAKHVRKTRGAPPGTVTYSQERALALRVEPARIERLLASEDGAAGRGA